MRVQRSLRPSPKTPSRRQRLRFGGDAWLAGRSAEDRAACHGVRQVDPKRRHLLTRGVRLRCRTRPLYLPWLQAAAHDRRSGQRRSDPPVSCEQARLPTMRSERPLLPKHSSPQSTTIDPRVRSRCCTLDRDIASRSRVAPAAEKGRDAVRSP
jgi:hypothetical protein